MKVSKPLATLIFGLLLSLTIIQTSSTSVKKSETNAHNAPHLRHLEGANVQGNSMFGQYKLVKEWVGDDKTYHYVADHSGSVKNWGNSKIIESIHMIVAFHDDSTFRVKIIDNNNKRWEIPEEYPFVETKSENLVTAEKSNCQVIIHPEPFSLYVTRKSTGDVIFDTRNHQFAYSNYYIELTTTLPSKDVYGFGERNYKFRMEPGTFTIWGRDDPKILEDTRGGSNTYSHHPVGLFRDQGKNFFLTLMKNSNAMDIVIGHQNTLTYKMVGGVIDLVFFVGEKDPEAVIVNYHKYLGRFTMMPFWSMGFHQSKWGYQNHDMMLDIVTHYINNDIPLDVIWSDIDYMIDKEIFTIDQGRYPFDKMKELMTKYKRHWVPIVDPGVKVDRTHGPGGRTGLERDVFIKNYRGDNLIGSVWPGRTYFPDFFHPKCEQWWSEMFEITHKMVPFSGIWLDMNEIANFVDGEENRWDVNQFDQIPYTPGSRPLKRKTVSLDAKHHNGAVQYDTHSLFAIQENAATYKYLKTKSKLPFILTRSASVGIGKYAAHWTGDNGAHWEYLQASIPGNFNFQIFGAPFVGADICGFMDDTTAELCARWMQLGALYPFARNHHEDRTRNQEPWTFREENSGITVVETSRLALKLRYSILKWYYSLFIQTYGAGTIFRPLMFEFPAEEELYTDKYNDWQLMLGKSVLATPQVQPGAMTVNAYFPKTTWYDLLTGQKMIDETTANRVLNVPTPYNAAVPLFLRAGHIVHRQNVDHVLSTEDLNDEFELVIAVNKNDKKDQLEAQGSIMGIKKFDDDSVHDRCMEDFCMYDVQLVIPNISKQSSIIEVTFNAQRKNTKVALDDIGISGLKIYGLPIQFMSEDEKRVCYASVTFLSGSDMRIAPPEVVKLTAVKNGVVELAFPKAFRVKDGDKIGLELIL